MSFYKLTQRLENWKFCQILTYSKQCQLFWFSLSTDKSWLNLLVVLLLRFKNAKVKRLTANYWWVENSDSLKGICFHSIGKNLKKKSDYGLTINRSSTTIIAAILLICAWISELKDLHLISTTYWLRKLLAV